jgi:hypothetical protein
LAIADGVAIETEEGKVKWWSDHEITLPFWSTAVKKIMLVQPSSAPAERVFSLLQNAFNKQQDVALEETVEVSIMLRYNKRDGWNMLCNKSHRARSLFLGIDYCVVLHSF